MSLENTSVDFNIFSYQKQRIRFWKQNFTLRQLTIKISKRHCEEDSAFPILRTDTLGTSVNLIAWNLQTFQIFVVNFLSSSVTPARPGKLKFICCVQNHRVSSKLCQNCLERLIVFLVKTFAGLIFDFKWSGDVN